MGDVSHSLTESSSEDAMTSGSGSDSEQQPRQRTNQPTTITLTQTLITGPDEKLNRRIPVQVIKENKLKAHDFTVFDHSLPIGISVGYQTGGTGRILAIAIVDERNGLLIEIDREKSEQRRQEGPSSSGGEAHRKLKLLQEYVLCRPVGRLVAFDMGPLVLSLYSECGLLVSDAVDLQSAFTPDERGRQEILCIEAALGKETEGIKYSNIKRVFETYTYDPGDRPCKLDMASRAWISQLIVADCVDGAVLEQMVGINLKDMDEVPRRIMMKTATDALRLDQIKSRETTHRFTKVTPGEEGVTKATAESYKHKFRGEKVVIVEISGERGTYFKQATALGDAGRDGTITAPNEGGVGLDTARIRSIITSGRDNMTAAEAQRAATILNILQSRNAFDKTGPFINNMWLPNRSGELVWPAEWAKEKPPQGLPSDQQPTQEYKLRALNASQQVAVNYMLSPRSNRGRLVIIQGPPGTGKTSVIGTCVAMAVAKPDFKGLYLVAQSNVAVKNIAEKLMDIEFEDWKLLVSKDFHHEWHEHLYHNPKFNKHFIRSERFKTVTPKDLKGIKVVLCTLSMLSNPNITKFTQHIPLQFLIVDEASQIEIGNYLSIFASFSSSLRKVCFIGDDKQLPPHGEEDLKSLESIFEVPHLKNRILFLDTQYRMPPQIGDIISECVYDSKLKSNPLHPIKDTQTACYFIDAIDGKEEKEGTSWKNIVEQDIVITLAQKLQEANKSYRIITPYEPQTRMIENKMKDTEGLTWEDTCFNVDAFQGNEEDFIIISLVRTQGLGFLTNLRRTNVMLTRCKRGMYIVCKKKFLHGKGGECLVGDVLDAFEKKFGDKVWLSVDNIEAGKLTNV